MARPRRKKIFYNNKVNVSEKTFSGIEIVKILNALNYEIGLDEKRIKKIIKDFYGQEYDISSIDALDLKTIAYVAYVRMNGGRFDTEFENKIDNKFKKLVEKHSCSDEKKNENNVIDVSEVMYRKAVNIVHEIEDEWMDNPYDYLKNNNIPTRYGNHVIAIWEQILDEMQSAYDKTDADCVEAYSHFTRRELKKKIKAYENALDEINRYFNNKKLQRKPRKVRRTKKTVNKLKHVKYQKEDNENKVVSVAPEKILGAKEVFLYNTKYKTITHLKSDSGFDIHRTMIMNINESESVTKRAGRKLKDVLDTILNGGKVARNKVMKNIKSKPAKLQTRLNQNTIILRVQK